MSLGNVDGKMYLLYENICTIRTKLKITKSEENAIMWISIFIVKNYIKYWYTVRNVNEAPINDIKLIHILNEYNSMIKKIANVCLLKFLNQLWCLNEECAVFAIFDQTAFEIWKKWLINSLNTKNESNWHQEWKTNFYREQKNYV